MFMVKWDGEPPSDKQEWMDILKDVFASTYGSYRVRFYPGAKGWKFKLEFREDLGMAEGEILANSAESVRFNVYQALVERGKPLDVNWRGE
jgi:hypothetical protein